MAKPSIAGRAAVAVALMIGFYLLATSIVLGLLYIPYAEFRYSDSVHPKVALLCLAGAGIILWSIIPRRDRFEAPGPELKRDEQPRLFDEIEEIARATGQAMPAEIYAVGDVNAWVTQRGGVMGIGSRRVMGLGLPLMQTLSISEFRAVLAHEFGHYHGGDTALGPWLYKTRASIFRTIENLAEHGGLLTKPFELYARLFLRVTEAISRRQELMADELAARVAGAGALASGLVGVSRAGAAYNAYWNNEVAPVLNAGYRPAVSAGYTFFVGVEEISKSLDDFVAEEMKNAIADPYDSHPPLAARLAALKCLPIGRSASGDEQRAASLLSDIEAVERQIVSTLTNASERGELKSISWSEVGRVVWQSHWSRQVADFSEELRSTTFESLSVKLADAERFGAAPELAHLTPEQRRDLAIGTFGCAFALALAANGWTIDAMPGAAVRAVRDGELLEPFRLVKDFAEGRLDSTGWTSLCERTGVARLPLTA